MDTNERLEHLRQIALDQFSVMRDALLPHMDDGESTFNAPKILKRIIAENAEMHRQLDWRDMDSAPDTECEIEAYFKKFNNVVWLTFSSAQGRWTWPDGKPLHAEIEKELTCWRPRPTPPRDEVE